MKVIGNVIRLCYLSSKRPTDGMFSQFFIAPVLQGPSYKPNNEFIFIPHL
jgi:hypothetical protein